MSLFKKRNLLDMLLLEINNKPDCVAVSYDDCGILTNKELLIHSIDMAICLQELESKKSECIGIFANGASETMIGVWGILFSGSAYLPISPDYPDERIRYMIKNSKVKVIITHPDLKSRLEFLAEDSVVIIELKDVKSQSSYKKAINTAKLLSSEITERNLAYVIYTSGSTGKPKGVMIEHQSIMNQMIWLKNKYFQKGSDVIIQKTPMSFDAAQWEILASCIGLKVAFGIAGLYRDAEELIKTIKHHKVTTLQCVPTLLQALLDIPEFRTCETLTTVFSGGEALTHKTATKFLAIFPKCKMVNLYGPTECTINSSSFDVTQETIKGGFDVIPIGKPVLNTHYHVLNKNGEEVQEGETGELYISGIQLAREYLNKPDNTAKQFVNRSGVGRLYRTGDLVYQCSSGLTHFIGRVDNQVKLRGYRVELDEIRHTIEKHEWIKSSAVIVKSHPDSNAQELLAFIELDENEAALMDQGNHDPHHQSKVSRTQVKMQLANKGIKGSRKLIGKKIIQLPGKKPTKKQVDMVFGRKTYRFFDGANSTKSGLIELCERANELKIDAQDISSFTMNGLGKVLRYFGQYDSPDRLLVKYGYASPGALYATQMYLELHQFEGLESGFYYYHPIHHHLVLICKINLKSERKIKVHFVGKKQAIEPIYKNNIQEVLEMEAGHMLGLFDKALSEHGLSIGKGDFHLKTKDKLICAHEDYYLGGFEIVSGVNQSSDDDKVDLYIQSHHGKVDDLPTGLYRFQQGKLEKVSSDVINKNKVIAINQQVYERSSFGISMVCNDKREWIRYISLGRKLQHLQMNDNQYGLMSSGYSSKSGNDLPSAKQMRKILKNNNIDMPALYFCIGGKVSPQQIKSKGMNEDSIHMKGAVEMLKDDIAEVLPDYMIPNNIYLVDKLPLMANGKVNHQALSEIQKTQEKTSYVEYTPPKTNMEIKVASIWATVMNRENISIHDDFFEIGGNSLTAVSIVNKLNKEFECKLAFQLLFKYPTIEKIAKKIGSTDKQADQRVILLNKNVSSPPVFCWPGLGGYPMGLRLLATKLNINKSFYGIQAHGINQDEVPYSTIEMMAQSDLKKIKQVQDKGPYVLWGYSFGARVAFEVAHQLESSGDEVESLYLIAPGSPKLQSKVELKSNKKPSFLNQAFVTILYSVFTRKITGDELSECLKESKDKDSFVNFICSRYQQLDIGLVNQIIKIVRQTYEFEYSFKELKTRKTNADVVIFKAQYDNYSFLDSCTDYSKNPPKIIHLNSDHYGILENKGVDELVPIIEQMMTNSKNLCKSL